MKKNFDKKGLKVKMKKNEGFFVLARTVAMKTSSFACLVYRRGFILIIKRNYFVHTNAWENESI